MAQITLPHQLTNGTVADASQVMANFNAIVNVVNGNLGSDNLASISGSDVTVVDLNGGTNVLNNFTKRFQAGLVIFENIPPRQFMSRDIVFPTAFPGKPLIVLGMLTGTPNVVDCGYSDVTGTRFRLHVFNGYDNTRSLEVSWLAIYTGAFA